MEKEKTLAMIKPDGVSGNYTEQIKSIIRESGFSIVREKMLQLNEETVAHFYAEHSGRSFFPNLMKYMTRYLLFYQFMQFHHCIFTYIISAVMKSCSD